MRTLTMILLAAAACRSGAAPGPATPQPEGGAAPPPVVERPVDPIPPIRGLEPALITLLGIDGRGAPASIDTAATARFATLSYRADGASEVAIYRFAEGKLVTEDTIALPAGDGGVRSWVWRTEDELVLLLADGTLRTIVDGTLAPLARPAKKLFAIKKPATGELDRFDRDEGLIATAGEVWLHHCVWGWAGDDDPCEVAVYVQVAPKPKAPKVAKVAPAARAPWTAEPAPGWTLSVDPVGERNTGVLRCAGPDGVSADLPAPADSFGYSADDAVWLSARPPIRLIKLWSPGADQPMSSDRFLGRCATGDVEPVRVEVGPSGFWTLGTRDEDDATNHGGALLLWQGRVVGRLPAAEQILFAP